MEAKQFLSLSLAHFAAGAAWAQAALALLRSAKLCNNDRAITLIRKDFEAKLKNFVDRSEKAYQNMISGQISSEVLEGEYQIASDKYRNNLTKIKRELDEVQVNETDE
jgi:hypothetical protein